MALEVAAERRLFTRAEYHRMGEVGIFSEDDRVELIRGEIVKMSPIGRYHVAFVDNLNQLLVTRLAGRAVVSVQNPVVLSDDTEPQPDLTVLRQRSYKHAEPAVADVLLLIEVAETSLRYDRVTKRPSTRRRGSRSTGSSAAGQKVSSGYAAPSTVATRTSRASPAPATP